MVEYVNIRLVIQLKGNDMSNKKRRCAHCKKYSLQGSGVIRGAQFFCGREHLIEYATSNTKKLASKGKAMRDKQERDYIRKRKQELKPISYWYNRLQNLVNQWIVHVRDKDKPCCTCGTANPNIKYDAGHFRTRGACPELRFYERNIHKQCSVRCNVHGSGMRLEYERFIVDTYGQEELDYINGKHEPLKKQLPNMESVKVLMDVYRQRLRDKGLKPCE